MNLFSFIDRGVKEAGGTQADKAAERAREEWLSQLQTYETRSWIHVGNSDYEAIAGLMVVLTLAGLVDAYENLSTETPEIRVIRGAISALEQCLRRREIITPDAARAASSACNHAAVVIRRASPKAIQHASLYLVQVTQ